MPRARCLTAGYGWHRVHVDTIYNYSMNSRCPARQAACTQRQLLADGAGVVSREMTTILAADVLYIVFNG